jgi:hypothetical protein
MSSQVDVKSLDDLKGFRAALVRFRSGATMELDRAESAIKDTHAWLAERRAHWRAEARRWSRAVEKAEGDLQHCESAEDNDDDRGNDCDDERRALAKAERCLEEAEHEIMLVDQAQRAVEEAARNYQVQAGRLRTELGRNVPNAATYLETQIQRLETYTHIPAAAELTVRRATSAARDASVAESSSNGSWRDVGIKLVPLALIDDSDSPITSDWEVHKGATKRKMDEGLKILHDTIIPALKEGRDREYFSELDLADLYDVYYGHSAVRLAKVGERYEVENGYHRIYRSRKLGLEVIPARVLVPAGD